jgi:hypothetical protein
LVTKRIPAPQHPLVLSPGFSVPLVPHAHWQYHVIGPFVVFVRDAFVAVISVACAGCGAKDSVAHIAPITREEAKSGLIKFDFIR